VVVYNCSAMADADCSTCFSLLYDVTRSKFNCRWCLHTCQSSHVTCSSSTNKCPPPAIHNVLTSLMFIHCWVSQFIAVQLLWNKLCAWRHDMPRPSPPPVGAKVPRAPPSRRNAAVVSHAQYVITVTAVHASRGD